MATRVTSGMYCYFTEFEMDEAFVTLSTNDSYSLGALVLGASLRSVKTSRKLVCMITTDVSHHFRLVTGSSHLTKNHNANCAAPCGPDRYHASQSHLGLS